jgi:steroid 5-alpha reductase family enzyme
MTELWSHALLGLSIMLAMGFITWLYSLYHEDVSIVDSLWSLMFLAGAISYSLSAAKLSAANVLLLTLVTVWSLRLSVFLTVRNWGQPEDRRYREIRQNNEPYFRFKSLYIVFGLQALLAWIISAPLLAALTSEFPINTVVILATLLWTAGFLIESIADNQLYRFKASKENSGKVLNTGLWRYSRHPNYFGEFLIWWAFYLFAVASGAWWTVFSPLLMSLLLLKVSGVTLMEKDINERRADYRQYIASTSAFIPWKPKQSVSYMQRGHQS